MLCWFLAPQFPKLDLSKLLQLCLAHDIVEAYCGDTFSFDDQAVINQKDRENAAVSILEKEWQDFPALLASVAEYEERSSPEANFVVALDRFHPMLMDYMSEGRSWHKLDITFDKLMTIKDRDLATSEIADYYNQLKELLVKNPQLFPRP
jgi:putative hydrolase of HD superfamily